MMLRSLTALVGTCLLAGSRLALAESPMPREIVEGYVKTLVVDSELAYLSLKRFESGALVDDKRLLALTRKDGEARSSLLRLQRPQALEGVTALFLQRPGAEAEVYQYLPEIGSVQRVRGAARSSPFLESDFSLQDLERETPDDNEYSRLPDALIQGELCYVIEAVPRHPDASSYRRRVLYIAKDSQHLLQLELYRAGETPAKVLHLFGYGSERVKGDTRRPERAVMVDAARGTSTTVRVIESRLNEDLPANLFEPTGIPEIRSEDMTQLLLGLQFTVALEE